MVGHGPGAAERGRAADAMPTCVVAADHPRVRESLRILLELFQACTIVGEAATAPEALALTTRLQPDVLLVDLAQPAADRLHVIRRVRAEVRPRRGGPGAVRGRGADPGAGARGAAAVVLKQAAGDAIIAAIEEAARASLAAPATVGAG